MNNVKSFWLGWGSLVVAGGGAYVVAKRNINAERQSRLEEQLRKKGINTALEQAERDKTVSAQTASSSGTAESDSVNDGTPVARGVVGAPNREIDYDPAPTHHQPATEWERQQEKRPYASKYEAPKPYKSPKGDRFS